MSGDAGFDVAAHHMETVAEMVAEAARCCMEEAAIPRMVVAGEMIARGLAVAFPEVLGADAARYEIATQVIKSVMDSLLAATPVEGSA